MGKLSYLQYALTAQFTPSRFLCPNCGCAKNHIVERKYFFTQLRRCSDCQLMFRTPTDDPSANGDYYDNEYSQGFTTQMPSDTELAQLIQTKFHTFDLARELHARGALSVILTGYPRFKLRGESLPQELIRTFPFIHAPYMAFPWRDRIGHYWMQQCEYLDQWSFSAYAARNLPECDIYVKLSCSSLRAGKKAKKRGARYVCDRGSSHIRVQDQILREEHERWGLPYAGIDPRIVDTEECEYGEADCVTVPSHFAYRSFLRQGIAPEKLRLLPYGVDLTRFEPAGVPAEGKFDILFVGGMSLRKGIQYLVQAFQQIRHPAKTLSFVGVPSVEIIELLRRRNLWPENARVLGHVPQNQLKTVMSRSHVMVLPSVEEGLALVQAQAMACACPVIGTHNPGAEDLFSDGQEGFIVPIRDVGALAERLQDFADHPGQRAEMGQRALAKVQSFGGWHRYGEKPYDLQRPRRFPRPPPRDSAVSFDHGGRMFHPLRHLRNVKERPATLRCRVAGQAGFA